MRMIMLINDLVTICYINDRLFYIFIMLTTNLSLCIWESEVLGVITHVLSSLIPIYTNECREI